MRVVVAHGWGTQGDSFSLVHKAQEVAHQRGVGHIRQAVCLPGTRAKPPSLLGVLHRVRGGQCAPYVTAVHTALFGDFCVGGIAQV